MLIPDEFFSIHYSGQQIPGSVLPIIENGANCQLFAYTLLQKNGFTIPPHRSSELWADEEHTHYVTDDQFQPLDLMLYHHQPDSWGAHVGLYIGDGKVIHLSRENNRPEIRLHKTFRDNPLYTHFIGAKRPGKK